MLADPPTTADLVLAVDDAGEPEIFRSLQGEGPHIGRPSVFVRLSNCNLSCKWCDTPYTWNWAGTPFAHARGAKYDKAKEQAGRTLGELRARLEAEPVRNLVVTGGEPMLQQQALASLFAALQGPGKAWAIDIETNGTLAPAEEFDRHVSAYVVSPKLSNSGMEASLRIRAKAVAWFSASPKACFKFVVDAPSDVDEVKALARAHSLPADRIWLMPAADGPSALARKEREVAAWALAFGFRYSDRLHLRLYGAKRGV
jgi:organic radical activating enzyme